MKLVLPLLLLSALVVVPVPAKAHLCDVDDPACVAQCILHDRLGGDPCAVRAMDPPSFGPCGAGETGVRVTVGSRTVPACVRAPSVTVGPCPPGTFGVIVYVDGGALTSCLA